MKKRLSGHRCTVKVKRIFEDDDDDSGVVVSSAELQRDQIRNGAKTSVWCYVPYLQNQIA